MSRVAPTAPAAPVAPAEPRADEAAHGGRPGAVRRNFVWLVVHQVFFRVGWVFKTESIIMPYFLDVLGGGPVVRSLLMVLNRIGASLPPALYARRLKLMRQKRWSLMATTIGSGVPFAVISLMWASGVWRDADGGAAWWTKWVFLALYGWFFAVVGLNQISVQTVQGKLVRAERRGRLFSLGVIFGAPLSVVAVAVLMPRFLAMPDGGFDYLFAAPAIAFTLAGLTMLAVRESDDDFSEPPANGLRRVGQAARLLVEDPRMRPVAIATAMYSSAFTLFPHYQTLARKSAGDGFDVQSLVTWTVTQHVAVAVASLFAGPIADRFGSRRAVQLAMLGSAAAPLTAIALANGGAAAVGGSFWLVFIPLGFTPVTNKMLLNYVLELVDRERHAQYTSSVGLCLALPVIVGSPLVGVLVEWFGIVPVFGGGAVVVLLAAASTLRLIETRPASRV